MIFIQNAPEKVVLPPSPTESLRDVSIPLKDPATSMPEINHTLLSRAVESSCVSQTGRKSDSSSSPQKHDTHLKLYVFDKLSSSEDNL